MSRSAMAVACASSLLFLTAACKLDTVVFGAEKVDAYVIPQTVVPDSLRREVTFQSGGETLRGYWLRQPGASARLTIVFSHGKGEHLAGHTEWSHAEFLWQSGFDVLTYDYRGFGRSTGKSLDEITLATDARSALTFALTQPGVTLAHTVSYGHSLGSAPAITLASTTPGLRALVIEAGFSNGQAMAESAVPMGIPVTWLLREPMLNTQRIAQVQTPVLVMHGDNDRLIPIAQGRDLHAAARDPKQFRLVAGAGHDNVPQTLGVAAFRTLIRTFTSADTP